MLLNLSLLCKFSITKANDPHLLIRTFDATVEQIVLNTIQDIIEI